MQTFGLPRHVTRGDRAAPPQPMRSASPAPPSTDGGTCGTVGASRRSHDAPTIHVGRHGRRRW